MGRRHFLGRLWLNPAKGTTTLFATRFLITLPYLLFFTTFLSVNQHCLATGVADSTGNLSKPISVHGFIKSDVWIDSRQSANARDGLFLLYPLKPQMSNQGLDINKNPSLGLSAITSRINALIRPPIESIKKKVIGYIEADFSGVSNQDIGGLRLRHAYIEWSSDQNDKVLFGYYWHPFFVTEVFPSVLALNTGAPFQPFIRSPQIRYTKSIRKFQLVATALTQMDYLSDGPNGRSYTYVSNSPLPNLNLRISYATKHWLWGGAVDFKALRPQLGGHQERGKDVLKSLSYMLYTKYQTDHFELRAKYILGKNLSDHLLLGGYIINYDSTTTIINDIRSTRHHFVWLNPTYSLNKSWDIGLFAGYAKRMKIIWREGDVVYARGQDIDYSYRLSMQLCKRIGDLLLSTEIEGSVAAYGNPVLGEEVLHNIKEVTNIRLQFSAFLFF